jgi:hypothetical protein
MVPMGSIRDNDRFCEIAEDAEVHAHFKKGMEKLLLYRCPDMVIARLLPAPIPTRFFRDIFGKIYALRGVFHRNFSFIRLELQEILKFAIYQTLSNEHGW